MTSPQPTPTRPGSAADAALYDAIATEHGRTHADVIELGIKMARRALQEPVIRQVPRSASPVPVAPNAALASLSAQLAELTAADDTDDSLLSMSASELRAVRLGLNGEVRS